MEHRWCRQPHGHGAAPARPRCCPPQQPSASQHTNWGPAPSGSTCSSVIKKPSVRCSERKGEEEIWAGEEGTFLTISKFRAPRSETGKSRLGARAAAEPGAGGELGGDILTSLPELPQTSRREDGSFCGLKTNGDVVVRTGRGAAKQNHRWHKLRMEQVPPPSLHCPHAVPAGPLRALSPAHRARLCPPSASPCSVQAPANSRKIRAAAQTGGAAKHPR